jgi:spore germination protein YaaH
MKLSGLRVSYLLILLTMGFSACTGEYSKMKSSTRRISSELRYLETGSAAVIAALGIAAAPENIDTTMNQMAPISQKNFIQQYDFLYDALNGKSNNNYLQSFEYDSLRTQYRRQGYGQKSLRGDVEVYTWYPYWMGDAWKTYDFNLISTISFFSYKIDPKTGSYLNPEQIAQWRQTELLDSARKYQTKTLLNIALEGTQNHLDFLENEAIWNVTLDSVAMLLKERDADGVEIDFSQLPKSSASKLVSFVEFMRDNLNFRFISKKMIVSLVVPPVPKTFPSDLRELDEFVDLFVVKGLDYHEIDGSIPAVSPMRSVTYGGFSLENTILQYLENGLNAKKSILALPLYGVQWAGTWDAKEGFYSTDFDKKVTLSEVSRAYKSQDSSYVLSPTVDQVTMTNYFFLEFPDGSSVDCWYDDSYTLSKKMDLALIKDFKGIGLWALGYDLGADEVWNVVEKKFASDVVYIKDPIAEIEGYPIQLAAFLRKYEKLFVVTFSILTIILVFSLALAFSDWRFRDTILARQLYRVIFLAVCIFLFVPFFSYFGILEGSNWRLVLLFILGAISSYCIQRYGGMMKINKP